VNPRPRPALDFTRRVRDLIRAVPRGKVTSYGRIAALAGDARQARQVAWILHSSSEKDRLPWHRVVGAAGRISLLPARGGRVQRRLLEAEGVRFGPGGRLDWSVYGWSPRRPRSRAFDGIDLSRLLD
jgi:methylated-DNA-protein-cysteine methyltransferase related protein